MKRATPPPGRGSCLSYEAQVGGGSNQGEILGSQRRLEGGKFLLGRLCLVCQCSISPFITTLTTPKPISPFHFVAGDNKITRFHFRIVMQNKKLSRTMLLFGEKSLF